MSFVRKVKLAGGGVRYRAIWEIAGRKHSRSFLKEREARQYASTMHDQVGRLGIGDVERLTFSAYAARHIAGLESRGQCSPPTVVAVRYAVALAEPYLGKLRLGEVGPIHLDALFAALLKGGDGKRALAGSTVSTVKSYLSSILTAARRQRLIPTNPVHDTLPVGAGRASKPRSFTVDELLRFIAAADATEAAAAASIPGLGTMARLLALTGVRRSEVLGLRWSRVDFDAATITIDSSVVCAKGAPLLRERTKTKGSTRPNTIPNDLVERLRLHRLAQKRARLQWGREWQDTDAVFCGPAGGLVWPPLATRLLSRAMKQAGLSGRQPVHGFRHSAATLLLASREIDVVAVSKRLGHSKVSITLDIYGSTDTERDRRASGILGGLIGG